MGVCAERSVPVGAGRGAQNLRALEGDDPIHPQQLDAFMARGAAMDEKFRKMAHDIAEGAQPLVFNGVAGLTVNAPACSTAWWATFFRPRRATSP